MLLTLKCGCEVLRIQQTEYLQADFGWQFFHLQIDQNCCKLCCQTETNNSAKKSEGKRESERDEEF